MTFDKTAIRNAATVIVLRDRLREPRILMGQRGARAAFMPNKFVFPGGAVDAADARVPLARPLPAVCADRLCEQAPDGIGHALAVAAIRELWEETGLVLGRPGAWPDGAPGDWSSYAASGHLPAADALQFVFRAITPPGRPRRFDARFFLVDATALHDDPDALGPGDRELGLLRWIELDTARALPIPFITGIVLSEIEAILAGSDAPRPAPFFRHDAQGSHFTML